MTSLHWSRYREQGFSLGIRFLFWLHHRLGPIAFKAAVYPVAFSYYLKNRAGRLAIQEYLQLYTARYPDAGIQANWRTGFNVFLNFANSARDKLEAWFSGFPADRVNFPKRDFLHQVVAGGKGGVLIGSHLGNLEVCRALGSLTDVRVNVLVHTKHAKKFNRMMQRLNPKSQLCLIQVTEVTPTLAMKLSLAVERGELVVIVGDRTPVNSHGRTCTVDFLGRPANFPLGPYILAALLKCPVYTLFCLRSPTGYDIYMDKLCDQVEMKRGNREGHLYILAAEFARRLEHYCRLAPLQWYNFYPFWNQK
ncbi:LpxL/LpxP family acyltransferase [Microbulbifer sp. 2201CG32-9]|uniref:LpxL/LpxP family acyltransferase n=1 Tax=Microbulbifer sp. 2201CG32-9 TaxID=3232309 RepID=UPI00345BD15E